MNRRGPLISGPDVDAWRGIYPALRQCGEVAVVERDGNDVGDLLAALSTNPAFGSHGCQSPDTDIGAELHGRVQKMLEECRSGVKVPVPPKRYGDHAILGWWSHVTLGYPVKAIPHLLRDEQGHRLLDEIGKVPEKTIRERMWVAKYWGTPYVTRSSLPGLSQIVEHWQLEFGVSVATTPEHPSGILRPLVGDNASFVGDRKSANGRSAKPGERISKGWMIRNSGSVTWEGRWLTRVGISKGSGLPESRRRVKIKKTVPGATAKISVPITAPNRPGTYETRWAITDQDDLKYFPGREDLEIVFTFVVTNVA